MWMLQAHPLDTVLPQTLKKMRHQESGDRPRKDNLNTQGTL
jgi:hypothetical protein